MEHVHDNHPDYKFPVDVEGIETNPKHVTYPQSHALIYTDGVVALTLYECCYFMWTVDDGSPLGGVLQKKTDRLSEASRGRIAEFHAAMTARQRPGPSQRVIDAVVDLYNAMPVCRGPEECGAKAVCQVDGFGYCDECEPIGAKDPWNLGICIRSLGDAIHEYDMGQVSVHELVEAGFTLAEALPQCVSCHQNAMVEHDADEHVFCDEHAPGRHTDLGYAKALRALHRAPARER